MNSKLAVVGILAVIIAELEKSHIHSIDFKIIFIDYLKSNIGSSV